jgi:indole-3-glycerol phosphate synthase
MAETILDRIVAAVRQRLEAEAAAPNLEESAREAAEFRFRCGLRSLSEALSGSQPSVIAECKRKSPSAGVLRADFDPLALARDYADAGAAAISIVTEPDFFDGNPSWVGAVRQSVALPILRKDFIITRRQILETAVLGADAVLLIQRLLDPPLLEELLAVAEEYHLEVLLEVFADEDPGPAVASGASIIGVNARNLATFEVRLDRVEAMAAELPDDLLRVAESGIRGPVELQRLHRAGFGAFLVGEHLVRAADPKNALRSLLGK